MKISHIKSKLQTIITNINQLQSHRDNLTQENLETEARLIAKAKQRMEKAFLEIESYPVEKIVHQLQQRKGRRSRRNAKVKLLKQKSARQVANPPQINLLAPKQSSLTTVAKKAELKSASKYLATIESLKTLHLLKSDDNSCKLDESLGPVQSIWKTTAEAISNEQQSVAPVEKQWEEVLFGGKPEIEENCSRKELIEKRCIWDSYLVAPDNTDGTHIPIGWVYPREDCRVEWKEFNC